MVGGNFEGEMLVLMGKLKCEGEIRDGEVRDGNFGNGQMTRYTPEDDPMKLFGLTTVRQVSDSLALTWHRCFTRIKGIQ